MEYVGVIGARDCTDETARLAEEVGRGIAREGWVLVCGGMGGVMEAACRGARSLGGVTLGILPGDDRREGNPYLTFSVVTGLGPARNLLVVRSCRALVAVDGGYGTLSELAFAAALGVPVIGLRTWEIDPRRNEGRTLLAGQADTAEEAVRRVRELLLGS